MRWMSRLKEGIHEDRLVDRVLKCRTNWRRLPAATVVEAATPRNASTFRRARSFCGAPLRDGRAVDLEREGVRVMKDYSQSLQNKTIGRRVRCD